MTAETQPGGPAASAAQLALAASLLDRPVGPDIVCTLEGGPVAMRTRIDDWQGVLAHATGRHPADGGVTLW